MDQQTVWAGVLRRLGAELPDFVLESWVRPLAVEPNGTGLRLLCPSAFHRDRIRERYLAPIARCAAEETGRAVNVSLGVRAFGAGVPEPAGDAASAPRRQPVAAVAAVATPAPDARAPAAPRVDAKPERAAAQNVAPVRRPPEQHVLPHTFESFIVGNCNELAQAAARELARGRQRLSPLFLASASGLGKTHLAKALASEVQRRDAARIVYSSAELFTNELTSAIRSKRTHGFKQRYRACDLLVIEDVQFVLGKAATQLELFHTIEHLLDTGRRVVLTGDRLPREIGDLEPRLASRMASGLVAEIERPDAQVRRRILKAKAAAGGVHLPDACLDRLVEAVRGSVRDLEGVLIQLVVSASLLKRAIDLELTEAALRKLAPDLASRRRSLEMRTVIGAVSAFFQVSAGALASRSRRRDVLLPRQLAMYLCRRYTDASLPAIGHAFGRKHSSVANAIACVERAILERAPLRYQVEAICERLDALAR
ncbi:MAG: chromosomal replication initiator protein DnaA [Deltaproteobacteria bacterium]|nr:MAG: chromosomal replication initiator protein DnaA [Deltaproteobacteria bacterium]